MAELFRDWREKWTACADELMCQELARISEVESEAWKAWEKSKQTKSVTTKERVEQKGWQGTAKVKITTEEPAGDPRFMQLVLECVEKRARLLGLLEVNKRVSAPAIEDVNEQAMRLLESLDSVVATLPANEQAKIRDVLTGAKASA
jgi:hypothetical protein